MKSVFKVLALTAACLCLSSMAFGQWTLFTVEEGATPGGTTYPTLTEALATAATYTGGPHKIKILAGTYDDVNMTVVNVDEIYGDPEAEPGDIVFDGGSNFLTLISGVTIQNMTIQGYDDALRGPGAGNCVIDNIIFFGNARAVVFTGAGTDNNMLSGCQILNHTWDAVQFDGNDNSVVGCTFDATPGFDVEIAGASGTVSACTFTGGGSYAVRLFGDDGTVTECTFDGYDGFGVQFDGDNGSVDNNLFTGNGSYGLQLASTASGNTVEDNCFIGNNGGGVQGYDSNGGNTWQHNYWSDDAGGAYALDGGAAASDGTPWTRENQVTGPASVEVWDPVSFDMMWMAPPCSETDPVMLAAYEFTVNYDPDFLQFVSAEYDEGYLGTTGDGALYTGIAVDEVAGTITFAATNFDLPGTGDGRLAFVEFNAIGTTASTIISIGSDYRDENNDPIPYGSQSADLAIVDTEAPTITLEYDDVIGNNTFSTHYDLVIHGDVTDNYCLYRVWYSWTGTGGWNLVENVTGTADTYGPWTVPLPGTEGSHTIYLRVGDCHSPRNYGYAQHTFTVDLSGPTVSDLTLTDSDGCADAGFTSSREIDVAWTPSEPCSEHQFWLTAPEGFLTYENPTTYMLPDADASYTLYVMLKDLYGNAGSWSAGVAITLDRIAPAPSAAWLVSDPTPAKTNDPNVSGDANLDAASGALYAKATEDGVDLECDAAGWVAIGDLPAAPRFSFTLSSPDGLKTVVFASKDGAGNVGTTSTSITLDTEAPDFDDFYIHSLTGAECANAFSPAFMAVYTFSATDIVTLEWSYDNSVWGFWKDLTGLPSPDSTTGSFTPPEGLKVIYARLVDDIGNVGTVAQDDLIVKTTPPVLGTVAAADKDGNGLNANWSDDAEVDVTITGGDMDDVRLAETNALLSAATYVAYSDPSTYQFTRTDIIAEGQPGRVWAEGKDCADNTTPLSGHYSNIVWFDLVFPVWNSIDINGGAAATNNPAVTVNVNITEGFQWRLWFSEDNTFATYTEYVTGVTVGGFSFTLSSGDGMKTVYARVFDNAGNFADTDVSIELDAQAPLAGTFVITSGNTLAIPGWTNSLSGNTWAFTPDPGDDDIDWMQITWMSSAITLSPFAEPAGGTLNTINDPGGTAPYPVQVRYRLRDDAMNYSGYYYASIMYDPDVPPAPSNASGVPGASVALSWDPVDDAQGYMIRYNFTNENPVYGSGPPPFPALPVQGILEVGLHPDNSYDFEGPQDDLYAFGIWTLSNAGLWSGSANNQVMENNYRLGDFEDPDEVLGSDGCLSFDPEFVALAVSYNTDLGDTYYDEYLDFAPTSDLSETGYAVPDTHVDFEDLVIFALNYKWSRARTECDGQKIVGGPALASAPDITVSAEIPSYSRIGEEFTVPISISDGTGIAGYHLVFDYNPAVLEVVSVNPGEVYQGVDRTFFYHDTEAEGIDISSAVLNDEGLRAGEIAVVTFRTRATGAVNLEDELLDIRDWSNQKATVSFELAAKGGSLPTEYQLSQNYPNPFNPTTTVELALPQAGQYRLTIYNVIGQVVEVFEGYSDAGYMTFNWDASGQASGVYLYKVTVGNFSATKKMVLLK